MGGPAAPSSRLRLRGWSTWRWVSVAVAVIVLLTAAVVVPALLRSHSVAPTALPTDPAAESASGQGVDAAARRPVAPIAGTPVAATTTNPLMADAGLATGNCTLPPWSRFEVGVRAYLKAVVDCLDRKWQPALARLHLPWHSPELDVTLEIKKTNCPGKPAPYASLECGGTIYIVPETYLNNTVGRQHTATVAVAVVAHEYGHHLQELSGIMGAASAAEAAAGDLEPAGLEISRRIELQAQCFAGLFMAASFDRAAVDVAAREQLSHGDFPGAAPDHGKPEHYGGWFTRGAGGTRLSDCNTFAAPSSDVA